MDGRGGVNPASSVDGGAVLVLGAGGQIGRRVVEQLVAMGRPVIALCRKPPSDIAFGANWLARDLTRPFDLAPYRPAAVIHATGAWLLPAHLANLRTAGVRRLVCFSSASV